MGTTDSNGIYLYDDTDGAPTPPVLNVGQQSVSIALSKLGVWYNVANVTERSAVIASHTPSASKPLMFYRADSTFTPKWEWTTDGTNFYPLIEQRIYLRVERTTSFQIASNSLVNLSLWDVVEGTNIYFDNAAGAATIPKNGVYRITANMDWQPNPSGSRLLLISKNYGLPSVKTVAADDRLANGGFITCTRTVRDIRFTANDTVRFFMLHSSGTGLGADFTYQPPAFSIEYIGA